MEANRQAIVLANGDLGVEGGADTAAARYRIFPSTRPSSRSEVHMLARALEGMLRKAGPRTTDALRAWDIAFSELVRQSFVTCADRGELLGRVRRAYDHYLAALVERVRFMEGTERETTLRRLEAENAELRTKVGQATHMARSNKVTGLFRAAAAEGHGKREAMLEVERKESTEKAKAGSPSEICVRAYSSCPPPEQAGVWKDMLQVATGKARVALLYQLWKMFGESKKPELMRNLTSDLPVEAQTAYALALASKMDYEQRVGLVEHLLRQFSAFEMSSFIDFLPYIWDDLAVQFTSKLLSKMSSSDRSRISTQLTKEIEISNAQAAADQGSDNAVAAVVAAAGAAGKATAALDPSSLFPNELTGWAALRPASSQAPSHDLAHSLSISVECLELALADFAEEHGGATFNVFGGGGGGGGVLGGGGGGGGDARGGGAAMLACKLGGRRASVAHTPPWARTVFNVLLRRVPKAAKDGKQRQQQSVAFSATALYAAREALWTYIVSLRSHAKANARAKLFARLCGLTKHEFSERRVELVVKLLAHLPMPDQRRLLHEMGTASIKGSRPDSAGAAAKANAADGGAAAAGAGAASSSADGMGPAFLPMEVVSGSQAPTLPAMLRTVEGELGGAHRIGSLVQKLEAHAVAETRSATRDGAATCVSVVDADVALLLIIDAFDGARLRLLADLAALHEQLEVQRASGALDAHGFIAALQNFDHSLSESAAAAIYVDCDLAASEERSKELAAANERAGAAGGAAVGAHQGAQTEAVSLTVFLRVCEEHQVTRNR